MALDQRTIPDTFLVGAGVALVGLLVVSRVGPRRATAPLALLLAVPLATPEARAGTDVDPVAAGRAVYIAEGCIHCHSQFIRPHTKDELPWGPSRPLAAMLAEEPPLPGNRRQGPDLQNVANRRSPDWNRLHLQEPRALAPGSTMPRYAHLFRDGDPRGEELVAYLASLGADTSAARAETVAAWDPPASVGDPRRGARLFTTLCASCHGADARGAGPLAPQLATPPADLVAGPRPRTTRPTPAATAAELARVIRFGVPGTAMAGHETLPDEAIAALTAHVAALSLPATTQ
jgi:cytochrome c oxidase cbb3-type subunit 2